MPIQEETAARAAGLIADADGVLVTAGAGMGVDSGLPDFRGDQGFWTAYPALGRARLHFDEIACPRSFADTPGLAWGFYGHRLVLYRKTVPHSGFSMLRDIAARLPRGLFVFTSNVDGQFQKANFDETRIVECHGSIHYLQCQDGCEDHVWSASGFKPDVDEARCQLRSPLPTCPHCRKVARPNILMFDDWSWLAQRKYAQQLRYRRWRSAVSAPVVVELGAGTAIPSVRIFGEEQDCPLIRINPREYQTDRLGHVGVVGSALAGIRSITEVLSAKGFFERPMQESVDTSEW